MRPRLDRLFSALATAVVFVALSGSASAQTLMFREFGGPTASTCSENVVLHDTLSKPPEPDKREVVAGGGVGMHVDFLELSGGGLANFCPNAKSALTFGLGIFPFRTKRVLLGAAANFDMSFGDTVTADDNTISFFRPEGVVEIFLKHQANTWTDANKKEHFREEGLALDIRVGRYQARSNYAFIGLVFFVNAGSRN